MYSSPLTGLSIQYNRRTCEDSSDWKSVLDSSVSCNSLSPTDEKCHHIDVNGETGFQSCPKACGNCFEDSPDTSDDRMNIRVNQQPMGLYSGENAETNEFEEMGSQLRNRGDLEDLFYQFTYEVNNKLNELSERISMTEDVDDAIEVRREGEAARGRVGSVCAKKVCGNTNIPQETNLRAQWQNACKNVECDQKLFSTCLEERWGGAEEESSDDRNCCELIVDVNQNNISPALAPEPTLGGEDCSGPYTIFENTTEEIINEDKMIYLRTIGAQLTEDSRGVGDTSSGSQAMTNKTFAQNILKTFKIIDNVSSPDISTDISNPNEVGTDPDNQARTRYYYNYSTPPLVGDKYIQLQSPSQRLPPDMKIEILLITKEDAALGSPTNTTLNSGVGWYSTNRSRDRYNVAVPEAISANLSQIIVRIKIKTESDGESDGESVFNPGLYIYGIYSLNEETSPPSGTIPLPIYGSKKNFNEKNQLDEDIDIEEYTVDSTADITADSTYKSFYCYIKNPNYYLTYPQYTISITDGGNNKVTTSIKDILLKHPAFKSNDDKILFSIFENANKATQLRGSGAPSSMIFSFPVSADGGGGEAPGGAGTSISECNNAVSILKWAGWGAVCFFGFSLLVTAVVMFFVKDKANVDYVDGGVAVVSVILSIFLCILNFIPLSSSDTRRNTLNWMIGIWWFFVVGRSLWKKISPALGGQLDKSLTRSFNLIIVSTLLLINFSVGEAEDESPDSIKDRINELDSCPGSDSDSDSDALSPTFSTVAIIIVHIIVALILIIGGGNKLPEGSLKKFLFIGLGVVFVVVDISFYHSSSTSHLYGFTASKKGNLSQLFVTLFRASRNFILLY
tara:strand:+ start:19705 stop:22254 length:2550 start_codon:yes stop_codon:yes gene_type:complete